MPNMTCLAEFDILVIFMLYKGKKIDGEIDRKNLHLVPRYSALKLVQINNSLCCSRALLIILGQNLGNPWAQSLKKLQAALVFRYGAPKRPPKYKHLR